LSAAYRSEEVTVRFIDDRYSHRCHIGIGEVHCGINSLRATTPGWGTGL
jgi:hypothetical protein